MRNIIKNTIENYLEEFRDETGTENYWRKPLIGYADARSPVFDDIKRITKVADHQHPTDYLADASIIISYFLPIRKEVVKGNSTGHKVGLASEPWDKCYIASFTLGDLINERIAEVVKQSGYSAAIPPNGCIDKVILKGCWSDRHVAWIAGLGTFGLNNFLITEKGCAGYYFSVITNLPIPPDQIQAGELCLYKRNGKCGVCVERCVAGAFSENGFDRNKCFEMTRNDQTRNKGAGAPVNDMDTIACGNCMTGLPCSSW